MAKVNYDKESNTINIKLKNGKIIDSDVRGNCVIDYNSKGEIVSVEILDFNLEKSAKKK